MLIKIPEGLASPREILIQHKGKEILWSTSTYSRKDHYKSFDLTNKLLADMPESVQDQIFDHYGSIYKILKEEFNDTAIVEDLNRRLRKHVTFILDCFDFEHSKALVLKQDIAIPEKIRDHNRRMDPDRTYTAAEYEDLLVICAIMPVMAPIAGEYSGTVRNRIKKDIIQIYCYELMMDSKIFDHPAMERLRIYVAASYSERNAEASPATVLEGPGKEFIGEWSIALIFMRTIFINKVLDKSTNMVSMFYNYITTNTAPRYLNRRNGGGVTSKSFGQTLKQDDESRGYLEESFRLKRSMAEGHIVMLSVGFGYVIEEMFRLFPDMSRKHYEDSLQNIKALMRDAGGSFKITDIQTKLCQIAMSRVGYHHNVTNLEKDARMACIAITQALAFSLGHPHIAALVTAREEPRPNLIGSSSSGTRYAADVRQEMRRVSPYIRVQNQTDSEPKTPIEDSVDALINAISATDYINRSPKYVGIIPPTLNLPTDMRSQFALYILKTNAR